MGKSDYERIAHVFASVSSNKMTEREKILLHVLAVRLSSYFGASNSQFSPHRFFEACKLPEVKK